MIKEIQSHLFNPLGRWTGNNFKEWPKIQRTHVVVLSRRRRRLDACWVVDVTGVTLSIRTLTD